MVSLTCMVEGGMLAAEGPCPEILVLKVGGLVGGIFQEFLLLGPRGKVVESYGALGPFPRRSLLQSQQISHFNWGWLAPTSNVIQGFQGTENPISIGLQLEWGNLNIVQIVL